MTTKHDKLTAIGIQIERLENFLKGVTINRYSQGTIKTLQNDLARLYQRKDRLENPPPKRTPTPANTATMVTGITKAAKLKGRG